LSIHIDVPGICRGALGFGTVIVFPGIDGAAGTRDGGTYRGGVYRGGGVGAYRGVVERDD
jgi:hypothetical protein